jgi:excisionase family DNA binding protein
MTTAISQLPANLLRALPAEEDALEALCHQLDEIARAEHPGRLVAANGETIEVPASAFRALRLVVERLARGQAITLVPHGTELTTQEAADLLRVSRPHLVKILDEGIVPHHKVGTHRRVALEDVLAYRERRGGARHEKLDELTRLSEELEGGYR